MAKHFVAVCVVCLLCADHLPCKAHLDGLAPGNGQLETLESHLSSSSFANERPVGGDYSLSGPTFNDKSQEHMTQSHFRRKRHAGHSHTPPHVDEYSMALNDNSERFVEKIFDHFGVGESKMMDLNGFESMLDYLGLTQLLVGTKSTAAGNYNSCLTANQFVERISSRGRAQPNTEELAKISKREVGGVASQMIKSTANELLDNGSGPSGKSAGQSGSNVIIRNDSNAEIEEPYRVDPAGHAVQIDRESMWNICPILLYHLLIPNNITCLGEKDIALASADEDLIAIREDDRTLVWVYASVSVLGVSLCGMLGFAVIPCMEKSFYQTMLQFLVALAVGTLAGDALLHLLPHAMMLSIETAEAGQAHTAMTLKGLVAVLGVIAFFAIERGLTMIAEWRKERQKKTQLPGRVRVMRDPESVSLNNSEKQCKHKYSSYPYCYDEIAMDTKDDHHNHGHEKKPLASISTTSLGTGQPFKQNSILPLTAQSQDDDSHLHFDHSQLGHHDGIGSANMATKNNGMCAHKSLSQVERLNSTGSNNKLTDNSTLSTTLEDGISIESSRMLKPIKHEESLTVILREHESKHHGHSHTHGHVHSPPGSLSAVAWMVVMGDGLHNFTDGMAIGAAFSNDIAGGFSTAIAVFCHELPHELGDFAVLLKAGMSARKAVYYNFLSSILSFFGMALGICIGDTPEASAWIFAIAAGLFIYIALVDMVPELTSSHHAGSNTVLQVLGMSAGLVIMLLIALNEDGLKSLFTEDSSRHHHHHNHH